LVLDDADESRKPQIEHVATLTDAIAFGNYRRLEKNQPPVLAVADQR
jgi:hypothetical protein